MRVERVGARWSDAANSRAQRHPWGRAVKASEYHYLIRGTRL